MNSQSMQSHSQEASHPSVERTRPRRALVPRADIFETSEAIVLTADLPGVSQDSLNITLEQDVLTLDGACTQTTRQGFSLAYQEYNDVDFRRVFTLSTDIDRERISATMKDGVLELILPKVEPAKARKITVRAG